MHNATLDRHDWFRAVLQAEGLTPAAKAVAGALAIQFANPKTGQINPSQETIADYLKLHRDTVKRILRELRNAGWLMSLGDGGRGKAPLLRLLTPGKIVPFRGRKGGTICPQEDEKRGGEMCGKGGQIVPAHNIAEKALEKEHAREPAQRPTPNTGDGFARCFAAERFADHRFIGNATDGLRLIRSGDYSTLNAWGEWLAAHGLPRLCELPIRQDAEKGNAFVFYLPTKQIPSAPDAEAEAIWYFQTLIDSEAARHAAQ